MKEAWRLLKANVTATVWVVVVPRRYALDAETGAIQAELRHLLRRAELYCDEGATPA